MCVSTTIVVLSDCDNSSNCAINSPQTQGDGSASSPMNLQVSKFNEEQVEEEPPVGDIDLLVRNCRGDNNVVSCDSNQFEAGETLICFVISSPPFSCSLLFRDGDDPLELSCFNRPIIGGGDQPIGCQVN
jgi:hypothetical protein